MQIKKITDEAFKKYGRVLKLDVSDLLRRLAGTPLPEDVVYVASDRELEKCSEYIEIQNSVYGGMPIQIGYCNGHNRILNAVEYHRDSEINIPISNTLFMLGLQQDIEDDHTYDTGKMEIFEAPTGAVVEFYGTTLHYAPCSKEGGFQVVVILPQGTNTEVPALRGRFAEDKLMTAKNKWLIAHPESGLDKDGAFIGLKGANLEV